MKKFFLSILVAIMFVAYSFYQRQGSQAIVLSPLPNVPTTNAQSNSSQNSTPASGAGSGAANPSTPSTAYKNGAYIGSVADAYYGNVQVKVIVSGGKITDVQFLQHPNDNPNSIYINSQAMPYLKQEALQAQSANVNVISGATDTSYAFTQSLAAALAKAG